MKNCLPWVALLGAIFMAWGCNPGMSSNAGKSQKLKVVSTVGMVDDIVRNIGGDRVESVALMGPGTDPHLYNPTARDIDRLTGADVVFYVGLHLEGRMQEILDKMTEAGKAIPVSQTIPKPLLLRPAELEGKYDPHIWFDVKVWQQAVKSVTLKLKRIDPEGGAYYEKNEQVYMQLLDKLHADVENELSAVPKSQRVLVTAHDAFGYFGKRYGFEVRGIQGTSTVAEAGIADIRELADFIVERKIRSIFVESSVPRATIEALQKATVARGWRVEIGGTLFSDAMGDADKPEGTYIGMVLHNARTIAEGLSP